MSIFSKFVNAVKNVIKSKSEKELEKIEQEISSKLPSMGEGTGNKVSLREVVSQLIVWIKSDNGVVTLLLAIAAVILYFALGDNVGMDVLSASGVIIAGTAGGRHVVDGPLTTELANQASPGLLRNEIDERIVKIRPMSTPIDQISRWGGTRTSGSMVVDYYSVDTRKTSSMLVEDFEGDTMGRIVALEVDEDASFDESETILVPEVMATDKDGSQREPLVLYVVSSSSSADGLQVVSVNNYHGEKKCVPALESGTTLVRMGRAAAELDVQTPQFQALPTKSQNYCQIFKTQVEESTFQKIANKEVGWSFSDQEEAAIIDMRLGMEKSFMFGHQCRLTHPVKRDEIFLTGGIWNQIDKTYEYQLSSFTEDNLVELSRKAFTGNAGSSRKLLIGGTALIERLNKMPLTRNANGTQKKTCWGIDFDEIVTKFGTLYVLCSEIFDECGHADDGMILDPEYIVKYSHVPFKTERLDLRKSGVRNTDAIVVTEASCLVLRYPTAHMRIVGKSNQ